MFSCNVGTKFKVNYFKRSLNFCYDQVQGIIFSNDLLTLEKLGVDKKLISEAYLSGDVISKIKTTCDELGVVQKQNQKTIESLVEKVETLKKEKQELQKIVNQIVDFHKDFETENEKKELQDVETQNTFRSSIAILNKKNKETNQSIENVSVRLEALIELLSEQIKDSKQMSDIMVPGITVDRIWNSLKNKNDAAILAIMYMMKKHFEDKGTRV